jgi:acetyl esterase/lipase
MLCAGFLALLWASALTASAQVATAKDAVLEERYPQPRVTFAGGVVGLPDLTYSTIPGYRQLKLDLYLPPGKTTSARPMVIYLAGGGWLADRPRNAGAFEDWPGVFASLAKKGYVVASIRYRLSGEARFPAAEHDTKTAIRWLRANAAKYGIDKNRVVIWGSSAGGQLAALAAVSCKDPAPPAAPSGAQSESASRVEESDCVQGAVIWYGIFDFEQMGPPPTAEGTNTSDRPDAASQFLGCRIAACGPGVARAASAVSFVDAHDPPMLLIHGSVDRVVPVKQSQGFYEVLKAQGVKAELLIIPNVDHSFIGKTPEITNAASNKALQKTIEFIDATIGREAK